MLSSEEAAAIANHLADDPTRLALQLRGRQGLRAPVVATQVELLQRARTKLPHWYAARCILARTPLEQCSSQAAATLKFEGLSGQLAIDLTGGLGVDSHALSKQYSQVIYVEADAERCEMARHNFALLGAGNIVVVHSTAEAYLPQAPDADLLYLDPDRRADGKRHITLAAMQPDVVTLLPRLLALAPQVCVKLSPMLDATQAARALHPHLHRLEALGLEGECKELLLWLQHQPCENPQWLARGPGWQLERSGASATPAVTTPRWAYEADPALYKLDMLANAAAHYLGQATLTGSRGYAMAPHEVSHWPGRRWPLLAILSNKKKEIALWLKAHRHSAAFIACREYPHSPDALRKEYKLKDSSTLGLLFTPQQVLVVGPKAKGL